MRPVLLLILFVRLTFGADITASGGWSETHTAADLVSGAGSDLPSSVTSTSGSTTLTILNVVGAWRVMVRRNSSPWNSHVSLYVRRTSAGTGSGSITGGDSYTEITGTDTEIFTGSDARSLVSLQYKLTGLNNNIPPATYLSTLTFTVQ